ncbi:MULTISPECIES: tetratricopeptide repeat protein [unclassified Anabaena]|uniref:tetratricopeptide repeat protein n=1 Tax=unclassified Anabaena TaxID=2619674 RepID=UPI00082E9692|nr:MULTISPECIES: tetratricopeptide repeat protein [unclassified Anabaena]
MASSGEDYFVVRKRQIERKKRILTIVSIVSFVGSTAFAAIPAIQRAIQSPASVNTTTSAESSLQQQAKGYELVLQREPDNQSALEKLAIMRLKLGDTQGAMELMERLVKLHPERQDYKTVFADVKKRMGESQSDR